MRTALLALAIASLSTVALAQTALPKDAEAKVASLAAKVPAILDDELSDYPSARFRNVKGNRSVTPEGREVFAFCGEMNAKNQMGGYTGWRRFALLPGDTNVLMTEGGMRGPLASLAPTVIANSCDKADLAWSSTDFTATFQPKASD